MAQFPFDFLEKIKHIEILNYIGNVTHLHVLSKVFRYKSRKV
jgi:hypothetical protein